MWASLLIGLIARHVKIERIGMGNLSRRTPDSSQEQSRKLDRFNYNAFYFLLFPTIQVYRFIYAHRWEFASFCKSYSCDRPDVEYGN